MNYFQKRLIEAQQQLYEIDVAIAEAQLANHYKASARRIIREMRLLYNDIKDGNISSVSQLYSYNRYYDLYNYLAEELHALGKDEIEAIEPRLTHLYDETSAMLTSSFGLGNQPNFNLAKTAMDYVWAPDGKKWSERVWGSTAALQDELISALVDACVSGRSNSELAADIASRFGTSFNEASRLVRTESSFIQNKAAIDRYTAAGITHIEILPSSDNRTCKSCSSLYDRAIPIEQVTAQEYLLPRHPNCRCTYLPIVNTYTKIKPKEA